MVVATLCCHGRRKPGKHLGILKLEWIKKREIQKLDHKTPNEIERDYGEGVGVRICRK